MSDSKQDGCKNASLEQQFAKTEATERFLEAVHGPVFTEREHLLIDRAVELAQKAIAEKMLRSGLIG